MERTSGRSESRSARGDASRHRAVPPACGARLDQRQGNGSGRFVSLGLLGRRLARPTESVEDRAWGRSVHVTPRSMAVLVYLAAAGGRVVSRNEILDAVWPRMAVTQDALSQCIVELRKAFHDDAKRASVIETIPKLGVRLISPVIDAPPGRQTAPVSRAATHGFAPAKSRKAPGSAPQFHVAGRATGGISAGGRAAVLATVLAAFWFAQGSEPPWRDPLAGADFTRVDRFRRGGGARHRFRRRTPCRFRLGPRRRLGRVAGSDRHRRLPEPHSGPDPGAAQPAVRMLQFSPGGTDVRIWTKTTDAAGGVVDHGWTVPVVGGGLRRDDEGISELDWSPDGARVVYHPSAPGDPLFVMAADDKGGGRQIYVAPPGIHCHFPLWSHDGKSIYFVRVSRRTKWTCGESTPAGGRRSDSRSTIRASVFPCCSTTNAAVPCDGGGRVRSVALRPGSRAAQIAARESRESPVDLDRCQLGRAAHRGNRVATHRDALASLARRRDGRRR